MTLPYERTRAVLAANTFLCDLMDPKQTPKVPKGIRQRAYRILRHFPWPSDMHLARKEAPRVFG